jgi:hypothetical protein
VLKVMLLPALLIITLRLSAYMMLPCRDSARRDDIDIIRIVEAITSSIHDNIIPSGQQNTGIDNNHHQY